MPTRNHGRGRGRQPHRRRPPERPAREPHGAEDLDLFEELRPALRSGEPLDLLGLVSGYLAATDPRSRDPFARPERWIGLPELVESFIGAPYAETTAVLTAIRHLVTDELLAARIDRELAERRHPLPDWLAGLARAHLEPRVWFLTHVLGDGDDYLFGVTLPSGHPLTALVYVDHNLGTVVKDAFVVPEPLEDVVIRMGTLLEDPDQTLTRTDPATARAVIEAAVDDGSRRLPSLSSDTWPMCRPLVEWMTRMLPAGGPAPRRPEWSEEELAVIAEAFFASPFGSALDRAEEQDLLGTVLWFSTRHATGDPWRWSPVTVEMLLADWFPRTVIADVAHLAKLPPLLRAWIRYCHDRRGIRADLTAATLAAVDAYEPRYQALIRGERQRTMAGLAEIIRAERLRRREETDIYRQYLAQEVGGIDALDALDAEPLPEEEFDWTGIPEEVHPAVRAILDECDSCADAVLDVEHRTAMRRFLARAARRDPALFRHRGSAVRGAAAVAWVIATGNHTIGSYGSPLTGRELLAHFAISGSVSDRVRPLLRAVGIDRTRGPVRLADPTLLVSERRRDLVDERDLDLTEE